MEFGQESSNEDATEKEEDGWIPISDESLGIYTSLKEKQGIQSVESQDSTQGTNINKDKAYTSMDSASTYTNDQRRFWA